MNSIINPIEHIQNMLKMPVANQSISDEQINNDGSLQLFTIAGRTRNIMYRYATIGSNGNINFHAMSPFNFIDSNQTEAQYRKKTVYASFNTDPQQNPNDPKQYFNNNLGNYLLLMKPNLVMNGKESPTFFNSLTLHNLRVKQALIPTDIENVDIKLINTPAAKLQQAVLQNSKEDLDTKAKVELNIQAYNEYEQEVLALVEQGLLTYSFILINPTPNSVSVGYGVEDSLRAVTHPGMNYNAIMNQNLPLSDIPVLNKYRTVVQIIESEDMAILFSNNNAMLGKRTIYTVTETNRSRYAISKLAIIKDYNNDTPIIIAITDTPNSLRTDARGRVESFEALLDKGINTFEVEGSLSPVVRLTDTNAGRNGNVVFELRVDKYKVYNSTGVRSTLDADAFGDLSFESVEGDETVAQSFVVDTSDNSTDNKDLSSGFEQDEELK